MVQFLAIICGLVFFIWVWHQWKNKRVYAHTGWTRFSSIEWITKEQSPAKFWLTIITQVLAGIVFLGIGLGIIKPEGL